MIVSTGSVNPDGSLNPGTLTGFVSFNVLGSGEFMTYNAGTVGGMMPAIVAIAGVIAIAVLSKKNVKGAILWGLLGSAVLYYVLAGIAYGCDVAAAAASRRRKHIQPLRRVRRVGQRFRWRRVL